MVGFSNAAQYFRPMLMELKTSFIQKKFICKINLDIHFQSTLYIDILFLEGNFEETAFVPCFLFDLQCYIWYVSWDETGEDSLHPDNEPISWYIEYD